MNRSLETDHSINGSRRSAHTESSGKTWVNNHAHVLRPKSNIDLAYLCRVLEHYDVTPFVTGTTRENRLRPVPPKFLFPSLHWRSSYGLRRSWTGQRHSEPSAAPPSPSSTSSSKPSSLTCSETLLRIRKGGPSIRSETCSNRCLMERVRNLVPQESSPSCG